MDELPRFEVYDDEDIVAAEPEVADLDEVAGPDACSLLTKKGGPTPIEPPGSRLETANQIRGRWPFPVIGSQNAGLRRFTRR